MEFTILVAGNQHSKYAEAICKEMEESARVRGTGIAKRSPDYIIKKMEEGKAIIALTDQHEFAGFCYIETWGHGQYVANSGLIVRPDLRKFGLAKKIKQKAFELSRKKYPDAKLFGLTTSLAVMKINSDLGYKPVTFSELTTDEDFWKGCQSCVNYDILTRTERKHCLCTGMLYDPQHMAQPAAKEEQSKQASGKNMKVYQRWLRLKQHVLMRKFAGTKVPKIRQPKTIAS
ncbi:MAG: GNAT family N-acetyltransferase [Flavobacteriales bacterium]|nr:GNAT family N-acetyltransferase [Flavobacteriales bacterium]MCB9449491.1 GNAT family N-acetyltransferase [Flavobacteriales bacterium]